MSLRARRLLGVAAMVAAALVTTAPDARAAGKRGRIAVAVEGADAEAARAQVAAVVSEDFERADDEGFRAALAREGQRGAIAGGLKTKQTKQQLVDRTRRALRRTGADHAVLVSVSTNAGHAAGSGKGKPRAARIVLVDASGTVEERTVSLDSGADGVGSYVRERLAKAHPPLEPAAAAPRATMEPDADAEPPASTPQADEDHGVDARTTVPRHEVGRELLAVALEIGGAHRDLAYSDKLTGDTRGYQLPAALMGGLSAEVYPFRDTSTRVLSDVGLTASYAQALGLESSQPGGASTSTSWRRYELGARGRFRTGAGPMPIVGLSVAYAAETFSLERAAIEPELADTDYRAVRGLVDVRVPLGRVAIFAAAGPLFVLSAGSGLDRYPRASVGGLDGELGGAFTFAPGFEARITARYRRVFYAMNSEVGDQSVAGGALDQSARLGAGVAYVY